MKLLVIGNKERTDKYLPDLAVVQDVEVVVTDRGTSDEGLLTLARDADFIMADAISPVSSALIENMPNLKLIHSEGVAYHLIDLDAARAREIAVCNNRGANAGAVAEQAILLMLGCLRDVVNGDHAVRIGQQIETKERMMVEGIRELGDCTVGLVGFGDIAQATAQRLKAWGCEVIYYRRRRLFSEEEQALAVAYADLDTLLAQSDIVSLHVPVTDETYHLANAEFFSKMKPGSLLINTARGEIVDQTALAEALEQGILAGVGLDTIDPEPVKADNFMLGLPDNIARKIIFSPHVGGITEGMFKRAHRTVWKNIDCMIKGEELVNRIV